VGGQVQTAIDSGINAHFLIKDGTENNGSETGLGFWSEAYGTTTLRPKLEVTYTAPPTVTVTGVSIAPGGVSPGDTEVGILQLSLVTDTGTAT